MPASRDASPRDTASRCGAANSSWAAVSRGRAAERESLVGRIAPPIPHGRGPTCAAERGGWVTACATACAGATHGGDGLTVVSRWAASLTPQDRRRRERRWRTRETRSAARSSGGAPWELGLLACGARSVATPWGAAAHSEGGAAGQLSSLRKSSIASAFERRAGRSKVATPAATGRSTAVVKTVVPTTMAMKS